MNKKVTTVLAGIFLAMALVLPSYILTETPAEDIKYFNNFLKDNPPPLDDTQLQQLMTEMNARHRTVFTLLAIFELICTILFVITLWLTIKA
jgi:preprotein translocase subunit SecG